MEIEGNKELYGTIRISGAKNATVALIPAAILTDEEATICNVPEITDTDALCDILNELNVDVKRASESIIINPQNMENVEIAEKYSKKLRASYYFMGALLGKFKKAVMYFPGGCSIGARPIDLHIMGLEKLGCKIKQEDQGDRTVMQITCPDGLKGADIFLDFPSVGATMNLILAATLAEGETKIENAACEPEIVNVATFLNNMGAKISTMLNGETDYTGSTVVGQRVERGADCPSGRKHVIDEDDARIVHIERDDGFTDQRQRAALAEVVTVKGDVEFRHPGAPPGQAFKRVAEPFGQRHALLVEADERIIVAAGVAAVLPDGARHPFDRPGDLLRRVESFSERHESLRVK